MLKRVWKAASVNDSVYRHRQRGAPASSRTHGRECCGQVQHGHDRNGLHRLAVKLRRPGHVAHADVFFSAVLGQASHVIRVLADRSVVL